MDNAMWCRCNHKTKGLLHIIHPNVVDSCLSPQTDVVVCLMPSKPHSPNLACRYQSTSRRWSTQQLTAADRQKALPPSSAFSFSARASLVICSHLAKTLRTFRFPFSYLKLAELATFKPDWTGQANPLSPSKVIGELLHTRTPDKSFFH